MESRESQRDKRIREVLQGKPSGGGNSPSAAAMRAREEIQGIEAERAANLEREKIIGATRKQQMATMKQAALLGASGMAASDAPVMSPLAQQAAAMNPQTQAILQKYGVKPGPRSTVTTTQTSGPNIRTTNTTNNNVRNEIKIVQPQIPMRQQQIAISPQGKSGNLDKFKAWLDSSFAKQANEYEVQQKEYRRREWNLARNSSKLFQKLSDSTKSLGEKMDPKNMGSTFGSQIKTLLFLFLATTIDKWWNPLMKKITSFEAGFRTVFGLPMNADLERNGAEGLSFVNKIKEFIGIDTKTEKGKNTTLLEGFKNVFTDGIDRLIDTLKLFIEDRRMALQKINLPDFKLPDTDWNPLGNMINSAFKGVMAPATEYLGNILSALLGGSSAVARKASNNLMTSAKKNFRHAYGGRYFTTESTDMFGNLKDDATYGMSEMLTRNLGTRDNVLRTGGIMTGLHMLEGNAQKSGGAVINPALLSRLGIGQDVIAQMLRSGQAQYVPYKLIMVPKTSAESEDYSGGSWGSYVGQEVLADASVGLLGGTMTGNEGWGRKTLRGVTNLLRMPGRALGITTPGMGNMIAAYMNSPFAALEGTLSYASANSGNSPFVTRAVPESDPRPGTPIRLLRITPAGFNTIKSKHGFKSFDPTDRNFRTWVEGQERNQKAIMGVRGNLVYEDQAGIEALNKGQMMGAAFDARLNEILNRPGPAKSTWNNLRTGVGNMVSGIGSRINVMATGISGNPSYARRNTIQNLYQALKNALDEKRRDLPEDKREVFARLMAAQAMVESSGKCPGGISKLAYEANNYGGVTAVKGRPVYYLNNGTISKWAKFNDMQDWANYQVGLLGGSRYNIFNADPSEYVSLLKRGGYFGENEADYASSLQSQLGNVNSVMGSYQYTSFTPTASMTAVTPPPTGAISLGANLSGNIIKGCGPGAVKDEKLKSILARRDTGKFYSTSKGWLWLGKDDYKSLCTAGPSTFYEAAGFNTMRASWWNTGSPATATSTRIGNVPGLKKIWNGTLAQLDSKGSSELKPGDIGVLFGKRKSGAPSAHGMMWDGYHWVSDTVQSHGACYRSGRLGDQSAQIWRMESFWPDDFGGGDESEASAGTSYIDSNGEVYEGTFMGAAGNVAGTVVGSMATAVNGVAQTIKGGGSSQVVGGYNPAALSASQKATIEWMKKNGAIEDESGIYIYDEETKTRSYLDPNSGISKTGNIMRANIMAVAHIGANGTIESYETNQEAIDLYKDRAIGKLLNIQINQGKSPESRTVDIYIGGFGDTDNFSEPARNYINNYLTGRIRYNLYEIYTDGSGYSSILTQRIPFLDTSGRPISETDFGTGDLGSVTASGDLSEGINPHRYDSGGLRHGWTYLFKKAGFKYKKFSSDLKETVSDYHPYLYGTLKIDITQNAMRIINAIMAYIRGEIESGDLKEKFGIDIDNLPGDADKFKKDRINGIRNLVTGIGASITRESRFGTSDEAKQLKMIDESISNWKSGKDKDRYVTYKLDNGDSYVIDSKLGIKIAETKNGQTTTLESKKILEQKGEDYNTYIRQADLTRGMIGSDDYESLYKMFMGDLDLSSEQNRKRARNEFLLRLISQKGSVKDAAGRDWITQVGRDGKIRYKRKFGDSELDDELSKDRDLYEGVMGFLGDRKNISKFWEEGLTAEEFNKIFGGNVRTKGPNWNNLEDVKSYFSSLGDVSETWKKAKTHLALKDSWLEENSENRALAEALVKKYNDEGESENLYDSNGTLIYRDGFGMVHAFGNVAETESGHKRATAYGNSDEGAIEFADQNAALKKLNLRTVAGQGALEAEYAVRFGAKPLGGGLMSFEYGGKRVVFNVNKVGDHADVGSILNNEYTKFYYKSKDKDQKADAIFGENSGWKELEGKRTITSYDNLPGWGMVATNQTVDDSAYAREVLYKAMNLHEGVSRVTGATEGNEIQKFTNAYTASIGQIQDERQQKFESDEINAKIEGHAGNIEDYTKKSAEFLKIISGALIEEVKDEDVRSDLKNQYEKATETELPKTEAELRAATIVNAVERDDVNAVTKNIIDQKNQAASAIQASILELAGANPDRDNNWILRGAFNRAVLTNNNLVGNDYFYRLTANGSWQNGLANQAKNPANKIQTSTEAIIKKEDGLLDDKLKTQKIEATVVNTRSEINDLEDKNVKRTEEILDKQQKNADEEERLLRERAEAIHKDPLEGMGHQPQPTISNNTISQGGNMTINIFGRNNPNPPTYKFFQNDGRKLID